MVDVVFVLLSVLFGSTTVVLAGAVCRLMLRCRHLQEELDARRQTEQRFIDDPWNGRRQRTMWSEPED